MYSVFIIESPLQLLCAMEANQMFFSKNNILLIRLYNNQKSNNQIEDILDKNKSKFKYIYNLSIINYLDLFSNIKYIFNILNNKDIENIFLGDNRGKVMKLILFLNKYFFRKQIIFLDDGLNTLNIYNDMKKGKIEVMPLFTFFDLEKINNQHIIFKHSFQTLKKSFLDFKIDKNIVYFFGSKSVEAGFIKESIYLEYINMIKMFYEEQGYIFIYILHRGENKSKLNKISNLNIKEFYYPAELQFLYDKKLPVMIASFYSTVLVTLKILFSCEKVDSFPFIYEELDNNVINKYKNNEKLLKQFKFIKFINLKELK